MVDGPGGSRLGRDWIHNIAADPHVVLHLKQSVVADISATARVITDAEERRPYIEAAARQWRRTDVPEMLQHSPLIVLTVDPDPSSDPSPDRQRGA